MDNLIEQINKADSGDAEAQFQVAWYIVWSEPSEPIDPDWLERAIDYFERSAEQGNGDAMLDLGAMYSQGRGVPYDKDKAFYWFNKAAEILHPKAFRCLGYWLGLSISTGYLDPAVPNFDYNAAFGYFLKGALLDEQNSLYEVGDMYFGGKYVEADQSFAFSLYEESYDIIEYVEDDCYADVCLRLGECYYRGIGCEQDTDKAGDYLERAVLGYELRIKRGDSPEFLMGGYNRAKFLLKRLDDDKKVEQATVVLKKEDNGYSDFLKSAWLGFPLAENELGAIHAAGKIVPQDYEKAFKHFAKEALSKSPLRYVALENLSKMYRNGLYVDKDVKFADYLLELGKENVRESEYRGL